jgi:hypothetical protein
MSQTDKETNALDRQCFPFIQCDNKKCRLKHEYTRGGLCGLRLNWRGKAVRIRFHFAGDREVSSWIRLGQVLNVLR